jgi:hypothetical protein
LEEWSLTLVAVAALVLVGIAPHWLPEAAAQSTIPSPTITTVSFSQNSSEFNITIIGKGFGTLPLALPQVGDTSYFRIGDAAQTGHAEWGYNGDANELNYESWSDTKIVVGGFMGSPGDALTIALWNPSTDMGATWGGNVPATSPGALNITSVDFSGVAPNMLITVSGSGFGKAPVSMPYTGDLNYFSLGDFRTRCAGTSASFNAGWNGWGVVPPSNVTLMFQSWSDNLIQISGFAGAYGKGCEVLMMGDPITITIWNTSDSQATGEQTSWGGFIISGQSVPPPTPLSQAFLVAVATVVIINIAAIAWWQSRRLPKLPPLLFETSKPETQPSPSKVPQQTDDDWVFELAFEKYGLFRGKKNDNAFWKCLITIIGSEFIPQLQPQPPNKPRRDPKTGRILFNAYDYERNSEFLAELYIAKKKKEGALDRAPDFAIDGQPLFAPTEKSLKIGDLRVDKGTFSKYLKALESKKAGLEYVVEGVPEQSQGTGPFYCLNRDKLSVIRGNFRAFLYKSNARMTKKSN